MLTIFTIPKPFDGHIGVIQRNAIQSWTRLRPVPEIYLCGDDPGCFEAAREFGCAYLPDIERNEYKTPLLNSAFSQINARARNDLLCYINSDIILLDDFLPAVARIPLRRFVMVAQRWNLEVLSGIDFQDPAWQDGLLDAVYKRGKLFYKNAIDLMVFPRSCTELINLPPFAVGRPLWDNWFLFAAGKSGIPIVDATRTVTLVHQNHDYEHVPQRTGPLWEGPEADRNILLAGGEDHFFDITNASYVLTKRFMLPALGGEYLYGRLQKLPLLIPWTRPFSKFVIGAWNAVSALLKRVRNSE